MARQFSVGALDAQCDKSGFSCGITPLDNYFRTQAGQDIRRRVAACFVARGVAGKVAGFYTLAAASLLLNELPDAQAKKLPRYPSVPTVRMGRLAVDQAFKGQGLGAALLADALARCEAANAGQPMTFFEMTTAAALLLFSEHPADLVLFEVGLGGRFDATNVIEQALVTVITPVSIDHTDLLGSDIKVIAAEKGGIIKARTPVVIARQEHEGSEAVLEQIAERLRAPLVRYGQEYHVIEENGRLVYQDETGLLDLPLPKMAGQHQQINAGTAIAALRTAGFGLQDTGLFERGITRADWPARMQNLGKGVLAARLPQDSELWLDGGHNLAGGRVLAHALTRLDRQNPRPLVLVSGMLASKDSVGFLMNFQGMAQHVFAVGIARQSASRPASEVAGHARQAGLTATVADTIEDALQQIGQQTWPVPPRVVICGSLYLAGDALARNKTPPV